MSNCPSCSEVAPSREDPCRWCGATGERVSSKLASVVVVLAVCATIVAIVAPNLRGARKSHAEAAAIEALRTIATQQQAYRSQRRTGDGRLEYGTLGELADARLIDPVLGRGIRRGYRFEAVVSPTRPAALWMAVANPAVPGATGDRSFAVNHDGVVYYTLEGPLALTDDCEIPPGMLPVGR